MPDDLDDKILENAQGPAKAAGDAGSVDQHPLSEQLAVSNTRLGLALKDAATGATTVRIKLTPCACTAETSSSGA